MKARQYWSFKGLLSFAQFDKIDWDLIAEVMATKPHLFQLWYSKHHSGWCAIGKNMKRWQFWNSDKCPCCLTHPETSTTHFFRCRSPALIAYRNEIYKSLFAWLTNQQTHPVLINMLQSVITGSRFQYPPGENRIWFPIYRNLTSLTKLQILQGFLHQSLTTLQQGYYNHIRSRKRGTK